MEVIDAPMPPFPDRDGGWYDFAPGETCLKRLPGRGFLKGYPYFTPEKGGVTREISLQAQQKSIRTPDAFFAYEKVVSCAVIPGAGGAAGGSWTRRRQTGRRAGRSARPAKPERQPEAERQAADG